MSAAELCDCNPDYGPCAVHSTYAIIRDGASTRTADELLDVFAHDAASVLEGFGVALAESDLQTLRDAESLLAESDGYCAWLPMDERGDAMRDALIDLGDRLESAIGERGYWVTRDDGYIVAMMHPDCPLLD